MPAGIIIIGVRDSGRKWSLYGFSVRKNRRGLTGGKKKWLGSFHLKRI